MRILHLFCGERRKTSVTSVLQRDAFAHQFSVDITEIDIANSVEQEGTLLQLSQGHFDAVLITPPSSSWSRVRSANFKGPPMMRSTTHPWGFPWAAKKFQTEILLDNMLVEFLIKVIDTLRLHPTSQHGILVLVFAEHPEDLGTVVRQEDSAILHPASIWQLPELRQLLMGDNPLELFTVVFGQCCFQAPGRKPTRLITNVKLLQSWGPTEWPSFDAAGFYSGPLQSFCPCTPSSHLARTADDLGFHPSTYPAAMDQALAKAILSEFTRLLAKVGEHSNRANPGSTPETEVSSNLASTTSTSPALLQTISQSSNKHSTAQAHTAACPSGREQMSEASPGDSQANTTALPHAILHSSSHHDIAQPHAATHTSSAPTQPGQAMSFFSEKQGQSKPHSKPGWGPPMEAHYKGDKRAINDGGGLCSQGRWPPGRRAGPSSPKGRQLAAEIRSMFVVWCSWAREQEVDGDIKTFWKMASGTVAASPFGAKMKELRARLDSYLESEGLSPRRRVTDCQCEIQFRRLHSMLVLLEDEDCSFLEEVVSTGVRLGVDMDMPRTPLVFEEKTRWSVEPTDEDLCDIESENYASAKENHEDIARQVLEEVEKGTILRMPEEEARRKFRGRLAIAALGAVPKEIGSNKVRLIHDGSYSVDVNRRIRVKDRLRFPLIDDVSAAMSHLEADTQDSGSGIRFCLVYDIARAHKLIPVHPEDWGLQAFRLPDGQTTDIFVHTRGTFGIASAAYWFGRCAACVIRLAHRLAHNFLEVFHLLYADDGWLAASGRNFWQKLLFWMFVLDLLEVPVSWEKVSGGTETDWIGYRLNVFTFERGISEKKTKWVVDWIDSKLKEGGVVGRDLKSVLGRLSFVAGALRHVRPFLAPLFSWSSSMAPGTYATFPDAVVILLEYIREEVRRKPMRRVTVPSPSGADVFRIDARAAQDEIVIGGWETNGNAEPSRARWFSVRLNRRNAPWAYAKGDPYRAIASLELVGVLIAVMLFGPGADWKAANRSVMLTAYTDNSSNTHVMKKFVSSKYPLSIIAMELACQLDLLDVELNLAWVPRSQNCQADDLTNERFEEFNPNHRIEVEFETLPFVVLHRLMDKAGELDSEMKAFKTSREAKRAAFAGGEVGGQGHKKRKSDLRWRDPW